MAISHVLHVVVRSHFADDDEDAADQDAADVLANENKDWLVEDNAMSVRVEHFVHGGQLFFVVEA